MHKENSSQCFQAKRNLASCLNLVLALLSQRNFCFAMPVQNTSELTPYVVIALLLVHLPAIPPILFAFLSHFCSYAYSRSCLPSPALLQSNLSSLPCYFLCRVYYQLCFLLTVLVPVPPPAQWHRVAGQ